MAKVGWSLVNSREKQGLEEQHPIINDTELVHIGAKELNKRIKSSGADKQEAKKIKGRKRTLKNRKYSADKRERQLDEMAELERKISIHRRDLKEYESEKVSRIKRAVFNTAKCIQRSTLFCAPGLVTFVPAVARLFCPALPGSLCFAQNEVDLCTV